MIELVSRGVQRVQSLNLIRFIACDEADANSHTLHSGICNSEALQACFCVRVAIRGYLSEPLCSVPVVSGHGQSVVFTNIARPMSASFKVYLKQRDVWWC